MADPAQCSSGPQGLPPPSTHWLAAVLYRLAHIPSPKPWLAYAVAVIAAAVATAVRWWLGSLVGQKLSPFITFYPLVMFTALYGGTGPGLLATTLSALAVTYLFLPPAPSFAVADPADQLGLALSCAVNVAVSLVCGALRAARLHTLAQARRTEASEERLRLATETAELGLYERDLLTDRVTLNPACQTILGVVEPFAPDLAPRSLHPADRDRVLAEVARAFDPALRAVCGAEFRILRPDGTVRWVVGRGRVLFDDSAPIPRPLKFLGVLIDITDHKQAEESLRQSEERFAAFMRHLPGAAWIKDPHGRYVYANPEAERVFSTPWSALRGKTDEEIFPAETARQFRENDRRAFEEGGKLQTTEVLRQADGLDHHSLISKFVVLGADGLPAYVGGVAFDITKEKQAEDALRESQERFRILFETSPLSTFLIDPETQHILDCNEQAAQTLGYTREELRHLAIADIDAHHTPEQIARNVARLAQGEHLTLETRHRLRSGEIREALVTVRPLRLQGRPVHYVASIDVTDARRAQEVLKRQTLHLHLLHQAAARLLVGQQPVDLLRQMHAQIAEALGVDAFMLYQSDPNGGRLHLEECAGVTENQRQKLQALRYGRAICVKPAEALQPMIATHVQTRDAPDRRFIRKLGFRSYLYYPLILHNRLHGSIAFASRHRDDYDRAELDFFHTMAGTLAEAFERQRLATELQRHAANLDRLVHERTAKLRETVAELEGFSYSLVHDMRAPLRAMLSYAGILELEAAERLDAEHSDLLRRIKLAALRMDRLVTDSLNYSKILLQDLPLGSVNLGPLIRGMVQTYPNLQPPAADISIEFADLIVQGNEAALTQIFSNLLGNAVKFVAPGVHPCVRIRAETPTPSTISPSPSQSEATAGQPPANHVLIWIEDNGIGIPKAQQEKIFGMFQRLHGPDEYSGTGIGLALVRKSLDRIGGRICLDSELGRGSRFCVLLPLAQPASRIRKPLTPPWPNMPTAPS